MPNYDPNKPHKVKISKNNNRFYTAYDMAEVKRMQNVRNSQIKRGEIEKPANNEAISHCGCGSSGCFVFPSWESVPQERIISWRRLHHPSTTETIDSVKCRFYKRDWYVGAKLGEDNLWYPVIGRRTYNDNEVVKVDNITIPPMATKKEMIAATQKGIDNTVRHWSYVMNSNS